MDGKNKIIPMTSPDIPRMLQANWRERIRTGAINLEKVFGSMSGLHLSFSEYAALITVGATHLCVKFGLQGDVENSEIVCVLYSLDTKHRIVSDYLVVSQPIKELGAGKGELTDQLAACWISNWNSCIASSQYDPRYFEVPGFDLHTSEVEDKVILGYNFKIQETVDVLLSNGPGKPVKNIHILFGLHGGPPEASAMPPSTSTLGVILHTSDNNGVFRGGGGYYDIATPCPDVCLG